MFHSYNTVIQYWWSYPGNRLTPDYPTNRKTTEYMPKKIPCHFHSISVHLDENEKKWNRNQLRIFLAPTVSTYLPAVTTNCLSVNQHCHNNFISSVYVIGYLLTTATRNNTNKRSYRCFWFSTFLWTLLMEERTLPLLLSHPLPKPWTADDVETNSYQNTTRQHPSHENETSSTLPEGHKDGANPPEDSCVLRENETEKQWSDTFMN